MIILLYMVFFANFPKGDPKVHPDPEAYLSLLVDAPHGIQ